jgi:hypothetical protein
MLALREWQRGLAAAVFSGEPASIIGHIDRGSDASTGITTADRVDIYRNNWREAFLKALAIGFRVIEQLVGKDYFRVLAFDYQLEHPSSSGDLNRIGDAFPEFLERRFTGTALAYLADVARLEQACEQVQLAPATPMGTIERLRDIPAQRYQELLLPVHPAARLLASVFPVSRIWISNQAGAAPEVIDLDSGAEFLLIRNVDDSLEFHRLRPGEYALASACSAGARLGAALEAALQASPGFDLGAALRRLFAAGAFRTF